MVTHILNTLVRCKPGTRLSTHLFHCFQLKRKSSPQSRWLSCVDVTVVTLLPPDTIMNNTLYLIETSLLSVIPRLVWPNSFLLFQVNWVMSKNKTSWRSITIYKRSVSTHYTIIYNLLSFLGKTRGRTSVEGIARAAAAGTGKTSRQGVLGKGLKVKVSATRRCLSRATVSGCRRRLTVLVAPRLPSPFFIVWNCKTSPTINELSQIIINITNFVCLPNDKAYCLLYYIMITYLAYKKCKARKLIVGLFGTVCMTEIFRLRVRVLLIANNCGLSE